MTKKKSKKNEEIADQNKMESAEEIFPETGSISDETDAVMSDVSLQDGDDVQTDESGDDAPSVDDEISSEDLFDDVRRTLIEENVKIEKEKKPGLWQRIRGRARKGEKSDEMTSPVREPEDLVDSNVVDIDSADEQQDEAGESIDELIEMLETDDGEETPLENITTSTVDQLEEDKLDKEVEKVDIDEQKRRAFQGGRSDDREENFSDVRAVALEGGEEVFVEVEVKKEDPVEDRLKSFENALKPYRRYIYFGIAFIGIVVIVATSALLYDVYKQSLPPEPVKEVENLPYPVVLNIPGNISFNLGRGTLENGRWDPRRPEWLEGTEICRWVAVPFSRQLEAVVRTLTRDDQLTLVMSNSDEWAYDVYSITQMSIEDMQEVSSTTPCLLLVLADADTDTRWVVTAYP